MAETSVHADVQGEPDHQGELHGVDSDSENEANPFIEFKHDAESKLTRCTEHDFDDIYL